MGEKAGAVKFVELVFVWVKEYVLSCSFWMLKKREKLMILVRSFLSS